MTTLLSQEEYVQCCGRHCPKCGSENLDCGVYEADGREVWQTIECLNYGSAWTDMYKLEGYIEFEEGEE